MHLASSIYPFVTSECVWSLSIPGIRSLPEASRYDPPMPRLPCTSVLTCYSQLMDGRVCAVEKILERQPDLKVLRDPPSLAGQRVRCVMVFHFDSGHAGVARCKVRAQAWTDPSLHSRPPMDKDMSMMLAGSVFNVAKADFEKRDPEVIRAVGAGAALRHLLQ